MIEAKATAWVTAAAMGGSTFLVGAWQSLFSGDVHPGVTVDQIPLVLWIGGALLMVIAGIRGILTTYRAMMEEIRIVTREETTKLLTEHAHAQEKAVAKLHARIDRLHQPNLAPADDDS